MPVKERRSLTFAEIDAEWKALGFEEGAPPTMDPQALAIDQQVYKRFKCQCGKRGLTFKPYHRGRQYRALVVCPEGHAEEV